MKLKDQVCSLELAKKLKELGVKQESLWWWRKEASHDWRLRFFEDFENLDDNDNVNFVLPELTISAFTCSELGEMLPKFIGSWKNKQNWSCRSSHDLDSKLFMVNTEANARAKMLIYLIENKLVEIPKREKIEIIEIFEKDKGLTKRIINGKEVTT